MIFAIVFCSVLVLLAAVWLFTYITLEIHAEKKALTGSVSIEIKYLFFSKKLNGQKSEHTETKSANLNEYKGMAKNAAKIFKETKSDLAEILKYCADKAISFKKLGISLKFGLNDPMETGLANGILYGIVYEILGFVHNLAHIENCVVNINPNFDEACFSAEFDCILKLKNVHITVIIVKLVRLYKKIKKCERE